MQSADIWSRLLMKSPKRPNIFVMISSLFWGPGGGGTARRPDNNSSGDGSVLLNILE
ncbi:hypothetical protein MCOR34_007087 [Pyricularia oryzae]|nr:hypothetical protein MCOR34_007087 [Pyricularia oryzae]KAI6413735.1 hypothetical protein MCOR20_002651 [Pyricularia oryzae]